MAQQANNVGVTLYKSRSLTNWRESETRLVHRVPEGAANLWAPEIHFIRGNWYIYFALDDGDNANHRMYVITALDPNNPLGSYTEQKRLTSLMSMIYQSRIQTTNSLLL
jgi:GH43 family beta-xylosidase